MRRRYFGLVLAAFGLCALGRSVWAEEPKFPDFAKVVAEAKTHEGLLRLHRKKEHLYAELAPGDFQREFLLLISISRGIGEGELLGGMSLYYGDDWILTFRRVDDRVHLVRKNVRFQADAGSPSAKAVQNSFTDSVLAALPIATIAPNGSVVVDLSNLCLSDFPGIAPLLSATVRSPCAFDRARSTYHEIKTFAHNLEIDVAAVYGTGRADATDNVPDTRGIQLGVHYSFSELPKTDYKPRKGDPRVGYFLSAVKDYTKETSETAFVRYINRWHLEKADANADPSPPKKPIVFYLEPTVPFRWRPYIREGILAWNKAFRNLGFADAIEVRDLPKDADPEDVNYNTFRWITADAGFAMGPSRVNPRTGQILDADIIFDADMVRYWQLEYDQLVETKNPRTRILDSSTDNKNAWCRCKECRIGTGMRAELSLLALTHIAAGKPELPDELIGQAIREVTMHEVGHTLGLRHNFKASTWKTLEQINQAKPDEPLVASVMDYAPANIQPKGKPQGQYYSAVIGPYDEWVIEYGYKVFSPSEEATKLAEIAGRAGKPELAYATDEDTRGIDPDPLTYRFDLGADPIAYSKHQIEVAQSLFPDIIERVTSKGEGYQKARSAFGRLLQTHLNACMSVVRIVGGQYMHRHHKGDADAKPPFVLVPAAKQREALNFLRDHLFSSHSFQFPAEMLNMLAPNRWAHWGIHFPARLEYPLHELILRYQQAALYDLFDPFSLERMRDNETRFPKGQEVFTVPELFQTLTKTIWKELDPPAKPGEKLAIDSMRRALQREYLQQLVRLRLYGNGVPEDARALASMHLRDLQGRVQARLVDAADDYTRAHLHECHDRIQRALAAQFQQATP